MQCSDDVDCSDACDEVWDIRKELLCHLQFLWFCDYEKLVHNLGVLEDLDVLEILDNLERFADLDD